MLKILITGSNGFLGSNLVRFFSSTRDYQVSATSQRPSLQSDEVKFYRGDLLDTKFVSDLFSRIRPDIIINTVSLVDVDLCEEKPSLAYDITVRTARNIALEAQEQGSRLFYISTDHLFDGKKSMYTEQDTPAPVNEYGRTKLLAERETLHIAPDPVIVRTNFFGWSLKGHISTFGEWVFNNLKEQKPMKLFTDYYFTPIEVTYMADAIHKVILTDFSGIINIAGSERCSKYDFGIAMAKTCNSNPSHIHPTKIAPDSFRAPRQRDLSLSVEKFRKTFNMKLPDLHESIEQNIRNIPVRQTHDI